MENKILFYNLEKMEIDIKMWALDWVSELDYTLNELNIVIPNNLNQNKFFYNQKRKIGEIDCSRWCVIFATLGALWDLFWHKFSDEEIEEIMQIAKKEYWRENWVWMYVNNWVDCVRRWWNNAYPEEQVRSYRTTVWSKIFEELLQKWHSVIVSYVSNVQYSVDSQDNWIIDWSYKGSTASWTWHCVRTNIKNSRDVDDNYIDILKYNTYQADVRNCDNYRTNCYFFLKKSDLSKQIYDSLEFANARLLYLIWKTNGQDPKKPIVREEVMAIVGQVYRDLANWLDSEKIKEIILKYNL